MRKSELEGKKFGRLTVLHRASSPSFWICRCECGNITPPVRASSLNSGNTKSCGCLKYENKGRPRLPNTKGFIPYNTFVELTKEHLIALVPVLQDAGVVFHIKQDDPKLGFSVMGRHFKRVRGQSKWHDVLRAAYMVLGDVPVKDDPNLTK